MAITPSTAARNAAVNAVAALINAGGAGKLRIFTAAFGTLLVELTFSNPAFGVASSGTATAAAITSGTATATGTAAVLRVVDGAGATVFDGTVGTSGADLIMATTSIVALAEVSASSLTLTLPAG
ncbi:MAG: hypothetical protein H0W48_00490 [Methylibium sp.]|nr:hypothetical protein [Methylibium sp.]